MIETKEKWKVINNSDGHYFISNKGTMKREEYYFIDKANRKQYRKYKIYKPIFNKQNGYYPYKYRGQNGVSKGEYVHRLVALHFIENPKPNEYQDINHKNGDKSINEDWNLEWCNRKINMEHASKNGLINRDSEKRKRQTKINQAIGLPKLFKSIVEYDANGKLVKIYDSYNKILTAGGNKSSLCDHRLSYKNKYYRDYNVLINQYGKIPNAINIVRIENIRSKKRKIYKSIDNNKNIKYYNKLSDLPITREELWYCFNHNIKDKEQRIWDILNI